MPALPTITLPGLNAAVSILGAGCWTIGGPATNNGIPIGWDHVDPAAALDGLHTARELGVTLFDTADVYGLGHSERLLGQLIADTGRDELVISSKVGYFAGTARHPYHPAQIRRQLDTTLDNLGTDHLDLYFLHSTSFGPDNEHLAGAVTTLRDLREQGMIRAIGMRAPHTFAQEWADSTGPRATAAARWLSLFHQVRPDVVTVRYNLLSPLYTAQETDIFTFARHHQVGVLIKQALGQGLILHYPTSLTRTFSPADHRSRDPEFQPAALIRLDGQLAALRNRFGTTPSDLARIALRYALHHAPDSAVLVGFRDANQIHTTITSLGDPLHPDEITEITALLHPTKKRTTDHAVHRG